ncbi:hypothetical protein EYF80_042186 [Liparis tanakae]|uniref:Uncharacterized protein n=1 Tax=Liparis tanakae TaxID=230148 RepID=A0A4Z2G3K6_9TELE|nr:hypothetical protein EYF80_042186 [Liparis tanakae]
MNTLTCSVSVKEQVDCLSHCNDTGNKAARLVDGAFDLRSSVLHLLRLLDGAQELDLLVLYLAYDTRNGITASRTRRRRTGRHSRGPRRAAEPIRRPTGSIMSAVNPLLSKEKRGARGMNGRKNEDEKKKNEDEMRRRVKRR